MATLVAPQPKSPLIKAGSSPTSPRLPSPPPIAEDQTGPQSPTPFMEQRKSPASPAAKPSEKSAPQWRIEPGMTAAQIAAGPKLVPFNMIDSAFQAQEYLKMLYQHHTTNSSDGTQSTVPLDHHSAQALCEAPAGCDESVWLFELTCLLTRKLNLLIAALFSCDPPCSAQTCSEMRASEWQYLCAVHEPPKACSAIDYSCHTMEWAERTLTNPSYFGSRLKAGTGKERKGTRPHRSDPAGYKHIANIVRRLYRLFAHAWYSHKAVFWDVENRIGLYTLCKVMSDTYGLIPEESYTIPAEAEGDAADINEQDEAMESIGEQFLPMALEDAIAQPMIEVAPSQIGPADPAAEGSGQDTSPLELIDTPDEDLSEELPKHSRTERHVSPVRPHAPRPSVVHTPSSRDKTKSKYPPKSSAKTSPKKGGRAAEKTAGAIDVASGEDPVARRVTKALPETEDLSLSDDSAEGSVSLTRAETIVKNVVDE